nr:MAG TPA: hypothetical protein [Caudoviricetes sp.]
MFNIYIYYVYKYFVFIISLRTANIIHIYIFQSG